MSTVLRLVGPSNVLYVDQVLGLLYNTGVRGDPTIPFTTIQSAIDAATTDDVVQIAPQSFAIAASLTIPAAVIRIAIQGWAPGNNLSTTAPAGQTVLVGAAGVTVFDLGANLGLTRCYIQDLAITTVGGGTAIQADGVAYAANTFLSGDLWLNNIQITCGNAALGLDLRYVRSAHIVNCFFGTPSTASTTLSIVGGGQIEFDRTIAPTSPVLLDYDGTDPLRTTTQMLVRVRGGSRLGGVGAASICTLTGQPRIEGDVSSLIGGFQGLNLVAAGGFVPSVTWYGVVGTSGTVVAFDFQTATRELPDTATAMTWDFRGCQFFGTSLWKVGGAAANPQTVRFEGAQALNAGTAITADANILMRCDYAVMPTAIFTTPAATGSIAPPVIHIPLVVVAPTPLVVAIGFRVPNVSYHVNVQYSTVASTSFAVNTQTVNTFVIDSQFVINPTNVSCELVFFG